MSIILYKAIPAEKKFIFSAGVFTLPYVTLAYAVLNFLSRRDEKDAALNADKNKTTVVQSKSAPVFTRQGGFPVKVTIAAPSLCTRCTSLHRCSPDRPEIS